MSGRVLVRLKVRRIGPLGADLPGDVIEVRRETAEWMMASGKAEALESREGRDDAPDRQA